MTDLMISGVKLREIKEVLVGGRKYFYSKFPCIQGRKIVSMYVASGLPKVGSYPTNEEMMYQLMSYVATYPVVQGTTNPIPGSEPILLNMESLIDNHVKSWEHLVEIEIGMLGYNCDFFLNGRISSFLGDIAQKVPAWVTKMLTLLSQASLPAEKQP